MQKLKLDCLLLEVDRTVSNLFSGFIQMQQVKMNQNVFISLFPIFCFKRKSTNTTTNMSKVGLMVTVTQSCWK